MNVGTIPSQQPSDQALRWAERTIGSRISGTRRLDATSSTVAEIVDELGRSFVLRLFTDAGWLSREPDLAEHEAAALELATSVALATPQLVAGDADGREAGVPATLMTRLPGGVAIPPRPDPSWLRTLAEIPVRIAAADATGFSWRYDPWISTSPVFPDNDLDTWESAAAVVARGLPSSPMVLLHRDHHPMNVLFNRGRLSGVVDWVNACVGPAPAEVAHCRVNLASMYGLAAADVVRDHWCSSTGADYDPTWDLVAALGTLPVEPYPPWSRVGLEISRDVMERRLGVLVRGALSDLGR